MDSRRSGDLPARSQGPVSYAESEASMTPSPYKPSHGGALNLSPEGHTEGSDEKYSISRSYDDEADVIEYSTPAQRKAGLRARKPNLSLKAKENVSLGRKCRTNSRGIMTANIARYFIFTLHVVVASMLTTSPHRSPDPCQ